jgi:serine/threonine protein phosphatase PrpC
MTFTTVAAAATDRGGRPSNEDHVLIGSGLFAVADGIGGLEEGEVASRLALDTIAAAFDADRSMAGLMRACQRANQIVWQQGAANGDEGAMGTTLAAVAITSDVGAVVSHVGDSRLYRLRAGRLDLITQDHTVVGELIGSGELSAQAARSHPHRHVLTRAIGIAPEVEVDIAELACQPGDRLILCTDGVVNALNADELQDAMTSDAGPQNAATGVIARALGNRADDNVSALIIDIC